VTFYVIEREGLSIFLRRDKLCLPPATPFVGVVACGNF